jgi:hypothetical protein
MAGAVLVESARPVPVGDAAIGSIAFRLWLRRLMVGLVGAAGTGAMTSALVTAVNASWIAARPTGAFGLGAEGPAGGRALGPLEGGAGEPLEGSAATLGTSELGAERPTGGDAAKPAKCGWALRKASGESMRIGKPGRDSGRYLVRALASELGSAPREGTLISAGGGTLGPVKGGTPRLAENGVPDCSMSARN